MTDREQKRINRRVSNHNILLFIVFAAIIVIFVIASLAQPDMEFSDEENRPLATFPEATGESFTDGSFFEGVSDYVSDQFFMRDNWITVNLNRQRAFGIKEASGVFLGSDGYLIGRPEKKDDEALKNTVGAINDFALRYPDVKKYAVVAPSPANILKDKLPDNAPVRDSANDIKQFYGKLDKNIKAIDVSTVLMSHSDEYIFYKTDHHWTTKGAGYAFEAMAKEMDITPVTESETYVVADDFRGTLASKSGCRDSKDTVEIYVPMGDLLKYVVNYVSEGEKTATIFSSKALESKDKYTVFFGGNHSLVEIQTGNDTKRCLVMFKDSYANCLMQYLLPYFDKIVMVDPRYYYDDIGTVMRNNAVTDVMFVYSFDTLASDKSLSDVLNGDGISANREGISLEDV